MALTKAQFKEVLDAVFNNGNPDTEYINSANTPSIKMYLNEMKKHADILEREEDINKYLVAILQTENHPYLNEGEVEYFSCKDIKDAILTTVDDLKEYNRGISSYIPMKRYIQNIGVFLGVSIADNIDEVQPLYYQDIVDIVKKYCTLNNKGLAYWGRYDVSGTATYKSYVPLMCLVDIAIYLNNLGVFREDLDTIYWGGQPYLLGFAADNNTYYTSWILNLRNNDNIKDYIPAISDFYTINNKNKFIEDCKTHFERMNYIDTYNTIDLLFNVYDNELDYNNILVLCIDTLNSSNQITKISICSVPKECFIGSGREYANYFCFYYYNNKNDYEYIRYTATVDTSTGIVTNSKNIYQRPKYSLYRKDISVLSYFVLISNINFNKLVARYFDETLTERSGSSYYYYRQVNGSYLGKLSNNVRYDNIKVSDGLIDNRQSLNDFLINKKYNLFDGNKDLVISCTGSNNYYYLFIFKNIHSLSSNKLSDISRNVYSVHLTNARWLNGAWSDYNYVTYMQYNDQDTSSTLKNSTLNFYEDIEYEVIKYKNDFSEEPIVVNSGTTNSYTFTNGVDEFSDGYLINVNLGELVEIADTESLEGLETIPSSIYPKRVVDLASFLTTYSGATYRTLSNPYYENDELVVTNLHTDTWVACNVTKNIPVDQSSAQNPDVDDLTDDEINDVTKDIDNSTNDDDDEDDPDSEGEKDPGENEGNNTIPTINDVFKYNMSQFETQWLLSEKEFQALGLLINSSDFLQNISTLIASVLGIDPLSGIISVQVAPISLIPNVDLTLQTMCIRGIEMTGNVKFKDTGLKSVTVQGNTLEENVKEFDLGEKLIDEKFGSYMDLIDTQMTLYLPFVGNIDLDIRDFYLGKLWIKGFVESYTGQIVYYIISKDKPDTKGNLQTKIVSTLTGNCYSTIPLTQDCYGSFMNSFTRG